MFWRNRTTISHYFPKSLGFLPFTALQTTLEHCRKSRSLGSQASLSISGASITLDEGVARPTIRSDLHPHAHADGCSLPETDLLVASGRLEIT